MLTRFEHFFYWTVFVCWGWLVLCRAISAIDASPDAARYGWLARRLPYGEHEITFTRLVRRGMPNQETKLRTAGGFGKRDKIKKLQMGSLRTAIGFGKRNWEYRTPETDPAPFLKMGSFRKENYPSEWNYEDTAEKDAEALLKIVQLFRELKQDSNEGTSLRTEEPERLYHYSRLTPNSLSPDDEP